ncbi:hypothetical protein Patl1_23628 [Pistacia atlantica]|uniref:Uncharacterized protein n=1 Tax=Pistacia atlantica TaxID=434234 RepID=A0ACC0ZYD0_9ROSI|nr:hypothetical protein Patl1_23628 [Pistacia atlantica]
MENEEGLNRKRRDDLLQWREIRDGIYTTGDGKVIHFTRVAGQEISTGTFFDRIICSSSPAHPSDNPCPQCGDYSRLDGVIISCIDCFLAGGDLYLFEYGVSPSP